MLVTEHRDFGTCTFRIYTKKEIERAWSSDGQGHDQAKKRENKCVVFPCSKEDAINISALFVRLIFAIPTCTHYDGNTISLFCGHMGTEQVYSGMKSTIAVVEKYLSTKDITISKSNIPLFANEQIDDEGIYE